MQNKKRDAYDWITLVITTVGLCGVLYYAYWAKVQAVANGNAATAAKDAALAAIRQNAIAHENAMLDLRAYVSPGQPNGDPIEMPLDKHGKPISIMIHF